MKIFTILSSGILLTSTLILSAQINGVGINTNTPVSTLTVNGSFGASYKEVTANYTLSATDYTIAFNGTADATVNLPSITTAIPGRQYYIKNVTTDKNLTVSSGSTSMRRGGGTPNGSSMLLPPGFFCTIIANSNTSGAVWDVMSLSDSKVAVTGWTLVGTDLKSIVNVKQAFPSGNSYTDVNGTNLTLTIPSNAQSSQVIVRWDVWGDIQVNNATGSLRFALRYTGPSSNQIPSIMMSSWSSPHDTYIRWTAPVVYSISGLSPGTYTFTLQVMRQEETGTIKDGPNLWGSQGQGQVYVK